MSDETPMPVPDQLYCVLLSLRQDTLLLPNAAVAEAIGQDALQVDASGPHWLAGTFHWNNRRVSAINFEPLNSDQWPLLNKRSRLVILHAISGRPDDTPFAIVCQGYPHLITLSQVAVTALPLRETDRPEFVLARVRIGNTEALIPDLDRIASLLMPAASDSSAS